jgi:hypothetical protein
MHIMRSVTNNEELAQRASARKMHCFPREVP